MLTESQWERIQAGREIVAQEIAYRRCFEYATAIRKVDNRGFCIQWLNDKCKHCPYR